MGSRPVGIERETGRTVIRRSPSAVTRSVAAVNAEMGIDETIREYVAIPLHHSFGLGRLRCVIAAGGTLVVNNGPFSPLALARAARLGLGDHRTLVALGWTSRQLALAALLVFAPWVFLGAGIGVVGGVLVSPHVASTCKEFISETARDFVAFLDTLTKSPRMAR